MRRRGFTLLEVLLASLIGAMVMIVCAMLLYSGNRTELTLAARSEQTGDLGRTRVVMQRTFSSLLMFKPKRVDARPGTGKPAAGTKAEEKPEGPAATPRVILEADRQLRNFQMVSRVFSGPAGRDGGRGLAMQPQRLEVVLTDWPVPQSGSGEDVLRSLGVRSRGGVRSKVSKAKAGEGSKAEGSERAGEPEKGDTAEKGGSADAAAEQLAEDSQTTVRAVRGAFEFWPQGLGGRWGERGALESVVQEDGKALSWELWWVPLAPRGELQGEPAPVVREGLGERYLVAKNIRFARWVAFRQRGHVTEMQAAEAKELPAYIELQYESTAGLTSEWMFELSFASGPETPPAAVATSLNPKAGVAGESKAGQGGGAKGAGRGGWGGQGVVKANGAGKEEK